MHARPILIRGEFFYPVVGRHIGPMSHVVIHICDGIKKVERVEQPDPIYIFRTSMTHGWRDGRIEWIAR